MVFALHIVEPAANTKEGMACGKVVLGLRDVHEPNGMQEINTIGFFLELSR